MIIMNYLANALPINGLNTGEISALYPNYFVPAGFTFAIWGVIYLLLGSFIMNSLYLYKNRGPVLENHIERISFWFFISCMANGLWIIFWHHQMIFYSILMMLILLYSLLKIYVSSLGAHYKLKEYWTFKLPFSVYLGWISVATIANFSVYLTDNDWNGFGINPEVWAVIMIIVACLIGIYLLLKFRDVVYNFVLIWAFTGLYFKASNSGVEFASRIVSITALGAIIVLSASIILSYILINKSYDLSR